MERRGAARMWTTSPYGWTPWRRGGARAPKSPDAGLGRLIGRFLKMREHWSDQAIFIHGRATVLKESGAMEFLGRGMADRVRIDAVGGVPGIADRFLNAPAVGWGDGVEQDELETFDSLKQKYDDLSAYVKTVEKQKEKLEAENRRLVADKSKSRPPGGDGAWSNWSVMLLMSVVVVVVAYLTKASYADRAVVPGGAMAEAVQTPPVLTAGPAAALEVEAVTAGAEAAAAAAAADAPPVKKADGAAA
ncbi:unnamed protein product [Prorocentrum cordatum]|uniref:Uncharacterized protein n=1 Tax=Prorocentrum cordatum TaxID=2364126 RepID=A0ABN9R4B4_9DINO|nr:unnamed protein product [Polarella glacialis]